MKKILRIYKWIIISITLQILLLLAIEKFFLHPGSKFTEQNDDNVFFNKNKKIKIDYEAEDIKLSFNGEYVAYKKRNEVYVINLKTDETIEEDLGKELDVTHYKWSEDRNTIVYSVKKESANQYYLQVLSHDFDNGNSNSLPKLTDIPRGCAISEIVFSSLTNTFYVKVDTSDSRARIYCFDINKKINLIRKVPINTQLIVPTYENILYFAHDGLIYKYDSKAYYTKEILNEGKYEIIGVDESDNLFVKRVLNNQTQFYYFTLDETKVKINILKKFENSKLNDVYVLKNADLYYILKNTIYNLKNGKEKEFLGDFIEIKEGKIITKDGNYLIYIEEF